MAASMKDCVVPGHISSLAPLAGAIKVTLTSGIAARFVMSVSSAEADLRLRSPITTTTNTIAAATIATLFFRAENGLRSTAKADLSLWFPLFVFAELAFSIFLVAPFSLRTRYQFLFWRLFIRVLFNALVNEAKYRRHKDECGNSSDE